MIKTNHQDRVEQRLQIHSVMAHVAVKRNYLFTSAHTHTHTHIVHYTKENWASQRKLTEHFATDLPHCREAT